MLTAAKEGAGKMANQRQIEMTYDYMDEIWRLSLGENADITGAMYNGDYTKSLERAQRDKHDYALNQTMFVPGWKVLDIGCGWGGALKYVREKGGHGIGLTLSTKQAQACALSGLNVYLLDWKTISVDTFGRVDIVVCIGAFEHFCSEQEYLAGKQEQIYARFFKLCHDLLPDNRRLFLQTMTWGKRVPKPESITLSATKGSDQYILAVIRKFYPGSWLPSGVEQIAKSAGKYFEVISVNNGRADYIETMSQWGKRLRKPSLRKMAAALRLTKNAVRDKDFRYRAESLWRSYNQECFKRQLMDHQRIVLRRLTD
jgi:cyclopropane-fatty-acyl-phospholipid synthase